MIEGYSNIQNYIHQMHYQAGNGYSNVTSSHWREVGGHNVLKSDDKLEVHGKGFGHRISNNIINAFCYIPEHILVNRLLRNHLSFPYYEVLGRRIAKAQKTLFNYDCARQVLALSYVFDNLKPHISILADKNNIYTENIKTCVVIGDGYGYTTSLLKDILPSAKLINVNLGKTLLFDVIYTEMACPNTKAILLTTSDDIENLSNSDAEIVFIEAENYEILNSIHADIYINIASMQEMDLPIINKYIKMMRANSHDRPYFYCCNRESKQLPDGSWINFSEYGWSEKDELLFDELCPWYQKYPTITPPFWRPFDGPIRHRLVRLSE